MTGGHGLTRPLTATTKDPAARKQTAAAYVSDGLLDAVPFRQGLSGLRLVEAVRVTQSTLADGPSEHRTISLNSC